MRYLSTPVLILVILTSVGVKSEGATAIAATKITATNRFPDPIGTSFAIPFGNDGGTDLFAQTFTAEVGGRLLSASVTAASLDPDPTGLQLAVAAIENGQTETILATAPLQGLYTNGRFSDIEVLNAVADFDGDQILLEDQQKYALLFVAVRLPSSYQVLGEQSFGTERVYAGGEIIRSRNGDPFQMLPGGDLVFEVIVEQIPEPMTLTLALIGTAIGCGRWRRGKATDEPLGRSREENGDIPVHRFFA